ncbi:MAG TPA: hypothetical protein VF755_26150 [Catenuloplanes sp.]|jgi:hypothetical protein
MQVVADGQMPRLDFVDPSDVCSRPGRRVDEWPYQYTMASVLVGTDVGNRLGVELKLL